VLAAARDLFAEGGAEAVTMRALARRLKVAPNALYSHVASKTQLLDELLDDLLASVEAPGTGVDDPVDGIAHLMASTYAVLTDHPDLVPLFLARQGARGPNAVELGRVMDALLARAGLRGAAVDEARRVLIIHTIGFAAFATGAPLASDAERPPAAEDSRREFARSLRWLLAGIVESAV
jgi:AcrR family transcriptional regulator